MTMSETEYFENGDVKHFVVRKNVYSKKRKTLTLLVSG